MKNPFVILFFSLAFVLWCACASIVAPSGGPKDEQAPGIVELSPSNFTVQFQSSRVEMVFDEYIKVKNLESELIVSPPLKNTPKATVKGKTLLIQIEDTLRANTTYTFNFGNAIVDLNEGNPLEDFKYIFSTGSFIDSLSLQGIVNPVYEEKLPEKMWLLAYRINENWNDSVPFLSKPEYLAQIKNQNFKISHMSKGHYLLLAIEDKNRNYMLDANEFQGFAKAHSSSDSGHVELFAFRPLDPLKFKGLRQRGVDRVNLLYNRKIYQDDSLKIFIDSGNVANYQINQDTAFFYLDSARDSLRLIASHRYGSDTTNLLLQKSDTNKIRVHLFPESNISPVDTLRIISSRPIVGIDSSRIYIHKDSLLPSFRLAHSNGKVFLFFEMEQETPYLIRVDSGALWDRLGATNDSTGFIVLQNSEETYGSLQVAKELHGNYIIELISKPGQVVRKVSASHFPVNIKHLKAGTYKLRLIEDLNNNGRWDPGNFLKSLQPEPCKYYTSPIEIRSNWELELSLD